MQVEQLRPALVTLAEALISPYLRGELEASDIVQQTLLEAHCQREQLAAYDERALLAWLRKALRNNLLDAIKHIRTLKNDHRRRIRTADIDDSLLRMEEVFVADDTTPSQIVERNERTTSLLSAMQQLPTNQRQAVMLKHLRGLTLREVAEVMQLSEPATAGLLHRGRQKLVRLLEAPTS